jgi:NAD(P)-dependent dehydrogenase (short-subunit alcohol dehydrogenase family)
MTAARGVAIVTGSSRGVAAATAKFLAREGFRVIINDAKSKSQGKSVVLNVASIAGVVAIGSSDASIASKAALIGMTKALARALDPAIRINALCPGFIQGEWLRDGVDPEMKQGAGRIPGLRAVRRSDHSTPASARAGRCAPYLLRGRKR